jgi:hypothetical protein
MTDASSCDDLPRPSDLYWLTKPNRWDILRTGKGYSMPIMIRQDGFRVIIDPNGHMPSHAHVLEADGEVRINLRSIEIGNEEP